MVNLRRRIQALLEKGLEAPDAIGVRATSVERIVECVQHGIPSIHKNGILRVAFFPYCDRVGFKPIRDLNKELRKQFSDSEEELRHDYNTSNQISDNRQSYGRHNAFNGSPEARELKLKEIYGGDFNPQELENPRLIEKIMKRTGFSQSKIEDLLNTLRTRQGVQLSLSKRVLQDFKVEVTDPQDVWIIESGSSRLPAWYISGISVTTELERRELESFLTVYR